MAEHTIVAVYDSEARADAAMRDLQAAHVPPEAIGRHAKKGTGSDAGTWERRPGFWESLFGGAMDHDPTIYDRSIDSGSTVITVKTPDEHHDAVEAILDRHNPVDLDERASLYGSTTPSAGTAGSVTTARSATQASPDDKIQLAEESLAIGKRAVRGGTTRVRRYVVETPVEEQVRLRDEKVTLERRPVTDGRAATTADFTDKTIEVSESREEAVVSKTARVTEEVALRKEATERTETVRDTVRRDEVKVEQVPGQSTPTLNETLPKKLGEGTLGR